MKSLRRFKIEPHTVIFDILVIWYAFYQTIHIVVNTSSMITLVNGGSVFHAPAPSGGWAEQILDGLIAMTIVDLGNGLLSILFIRGYFRVTKWYLWLGAVTLSATVYSLAIINFVSISSGAWDANAGVYIIFNLIALPVLILFGLIAVMVVRGRS